MKIQNNINNSIFQYAALYGFNTIDNPEKRKKSLLRFCQNNKVLGTFLIANEGINGTVSGQPESIENVVNCSLCALRTLCFSPSFTRLSPV